MLVKAVNQLIDQCHRVFDKTRKRTLFSSRLPGTQNKMIHEREGLETLLGILRSVTHTLIKRLKVSTLQRVNIRNFSQKRAKEGVLR